METTKAGVELKAREKFGQSAKVFPFATYHGTERWWGLAVNGQVIGCRRELAELPVLIRRGPAMEALNAKSTAQDAPGRAPMDRADS